MWLDAAELEQGGREGTGVAEGKVEGNRRARARRYRWPDAPGLAVPTVMGQMNTLGELELAGTSQTPPDLPVPGTTLKV